MQTFRRVGAYKSYVCPATKLLNRFSCIDSEDRVHGPDKTLSDPLPSWYHIYADGSGGSSGSDEAPQNAGWGVTVFSEHNPGMHTAWRAALYGPVNVAPYDPMRLGARVSNNTGEVSAIGEACRYLLQVNTLLPPDHPRQATTYYDSTYAYGAVTRLNKSKGNVELVDTVATLVDAVRRHFTLDFQHVRAHTDIYGNEVANRLAARGVAGRISSHA